MGPRQPTGAQRRGAPQKHRATIRAWEAAADGDTAIAIAFDSAFHTAGIAPAAAAAPVPSGQRPGPRRQPRGATTLHDSAGPRAAQTQGGGGFAREVVPASGLKLGPCLSDDAHKVASSVLKAGNGTRDTAPRPRRIRTTDGIDDAFAVDEAGLVI